MLYLSIMILLLDTSTDYSILALAQDDELVAEYPLPVGQQSMVILPSIKGFLKCHGLAMSDLESIAIGIGPGAFTGTRIGVTIAKTLGYALDIPLLPFCSLQALPPKPGLFVNVFNAKGGQLYTLRGKHENGQITYAEPTLSPLETLLDIATDAPCISPHVADIQAITKSHSLKWHAAQPSAYHIAKLLPTLKSTPAEAVKVLYLRIP